jgi:Protein of unknown function, DUF547
VTGSALTRSWKKRFAVWALAGGLASGASTAEAAGPSRAVDTAAWGRALELAQHRGGLDYARLAADRSALDAYLASLAEARPESWEEPERLAFWINAYNAVVTYHVLERYPGLGSVREVDGFFDELTFRVAGEERTLDEIEGRARDLGDPRVHFAVVCASASCPDLRFEPYSGQRLEAQLAEQTRNFLSDLGKGLRYDRAANDVWLSSIFKWYAGDFTGGSTLLAYVARGPVLAWVLPHLPLELGAELERREPSVRYLDYDWSLNDRPK